MKRLAWIAFHIAAIAAVSFYPTLGRAQSAGYERTFPQPKAVVEKALQQMQPSMSGRLPALEGFAAAGDHPLSSYRRGFYQMTAQVTSTASGTTSVHLTTKVTAWFTDSVASHSGYQLLTSNGRLEADLLDQLSDQLSVGMLISPTKTTNSPHSSTVGKNTATSEPAISAPMPRLPDAGGTFSSSVQQNLAAGSQKDSVNSLDSNSELQAEATNLEEILKNQAHPSNLVAVKKSGTPIVSSPSLTAKALFLASAHDEFEMLNFNRDWVHVRISGLSRGWIWRNSVELPDSVPDSDAPSTTTSTPAAELFHVSREETAPFPGDWEPLRGKNVKIVSVEKIDDLQKDDQKNEGPPLKLAFAKSLLDENYKELEQKSDDLAGIVVIFDSSDGGMIAATFATLQRWKAGRLSDSALWHQCFFDPPETFVPSGSPGSK
jgi:hypothetical protein